VDELIFSLLLILAGCGLLFLGGDMLVSSATFIASRIGMSPVAIGATVVAIGTSAPELSVSLDAAFNGHTDISVGNIVGSNICNIILVLGLCGLVGRLRVSRQVYRIDFPILVVVSAVFTAMIYDQHISRVEGMFLLLSFAAYVIWNIRRAPDFTDVEGISPDNGNSSESEEDPQQNWIGPVSRAVAGIICLGFGANLLVDGSLQALEPLHLSEAAIGVSIVALGTSVPEIGTSIIAARKGHGDLAVGNAIGSSVFNILGVLGLTASLHPLAATGVSLIDGVLLIVTSLVGLVLLARPNGIRRVQGAILVGAYSLYLIAAVSSRIG